MAAGLQSRIEETRVARQRAKPHKVIDARSLANQVIYPRSTSRTQDNIALGLADTQVSLTVEEVALARVAREWNEFQTQSSRARTAVNKYLIEIIKENPETVTPQTLMEHAVDIVMEASEKDPKGLPLKILREEKVNSGVRRGMAEASSRRAERSNPNVPTQSRPSANKNTVPGTPSRRPENAATQQLTPRGRQCQRTGSSTSNWLDQKTSVWFDPNVYRPSSADVKDTVPGTPSRRAENAATQQFTPRRQNPVWLDQTTSVWNTNEPTQIYGRPSDVEQETAVKTVEHTVKRGNDILNTALGNKRIARKVVNYLTRDPAGIKMLKSPRGQRLLRHLHSLAQANSTGKALKIEGGGILVGLAALFIVEKGLGELFDLLEIQNKQARECASLTLSVMATGEAQNLLHRAVLGEKASRAAKMLRMLQNPTISARVLAGIKHVGGGLAQIAFVSIISQGILEALRVNPELAAKINLGSSFVIPAAARFGYRQLATKVGESALSRVGLSFLGRAAVAVGVAKMLTDNLYGIIASDYRISVNNRVYDDVQVDAVRSGVLDMSWAFIREMFHKIGGSALEAGITQDHANKKIGVIKQDIIEAKETRSKLREDLKRYIMAGGDLRALTKKVKFDAKVVSVEKKRNPYGSSRLLCGDIIKEVEVKKYIYEKKVFEFMVEYAAKHPGVTFGSKEHIDAVRKHFGNKITADECIRIFEKGMIISWQSRLAYLHFIQPSIFGEFESETLNDDVREFATDKGVLRRDKLGVFLRRFLNI